MPPFPTPPPLVPSWAEVEKRCEAAFLGLALGDALGATTEFMTPHEIRCKYGVHRKIIGGGWLNLRPGRVTDDTEMSVYMGRALRTSGVWDLRVIAEAFVAWLRSRPVDIGATCARGIRAYLHQGLLEVPPNEWDAGNGAVMRMAPVALFTLGDSELLQRYALEQAHLTHNHPLSDAACVAVGQLVQRAILGGSIGDLCADAAYFVQDHPKFRYRPYLGNSSPYVVDTMQTVMHFFLNTDTFEDCLIGTVNQGGDADTTGAIAGMIAGAFYGPSALPNAWLRKLDPAIREETAELAVSLARLSPLYREAFGPEQSAAHTPDEGLCQ